MNCQEIERFLLLVENDEIPNQIPQEITDHLEICAHCRNNLYLTQLENEVLMEPKTIPQISPDFIQRTMQMLPQDLYPIMNPANEIKKTSSQPITVKKRSSRRFLQTAAAVCLVLGAGFFFRDDLTQFFPGNTAPQVRLVAEESPAFDSTETAATPKAVAESFSTAEETDEFPPVDIESLMVSSLEPAAFDIKTSPTANETALYPAMNPYQSAPASPYVSTIANDYQDTSRSGAGGTISAQEAAQVKLGLFPERLLSGIPANYRLSEFSIKDAVYTFQYQDDSENFLILTLTPHNSSEFTSDADLQHLIVYEDMTYQVTIMGSLPDAELSQILNDIEIIK